MAGRRLSLAEAAEQLGVHYMTAYRYVRTGRLPASKDSSNNWVVDADDLAEVQRGPRQFEGDPSERQSEQLRSRLLSSDEIGAWAVLENALSSGMGPEAVVVDLLGETLSELGEQWARGEISVADEHRASSVGARLVARMGARFGRRGVKRGAVVLASPEGELHSLPISIAANVLRWRGIDVVEVGAHTPAASLGALVAVEAVARHPGFLAVAIGCTTSGSELAARQAVAAVRERTAERGLYVPVLLGGAAIGGHEHAVALGADAYSGRRAGELADAVAALATFAPPPNAA